MSSLCFMTFKMLKSVSAKLTTSLARALCLPKSQTQTRALTSSRTTVEKDKSPPSTSTSSTSTSTSPTPDPDPTLQSTEPESRNQNQAQYTATDAANFSRLGASVTAMPPVEAQSLSLNPSPVTTLRCERLGAVVSSSRGEKREREVYTTAHAAEFMRRGACMVVWPG
ncbi:hypothetical protein DL95DRAFT_378192, partial [Leptodontidium sp. 2 PMI_412]